MTDVITTLHPEGAPEDNLYPNVKDENIPSNIRRKGTLLWENGNSSADLGLVTIDPVDVSQFEYLRIYAKYYKYERRALAYDAEAMLYLGNGTNVFVSASNQQGAEVASRIIAILQGQIRIEHGYCNGTLSDDYLVITRIYGIK